MPGSKPASTAHGTSWQYRVGKCRCTACRKWNSDERAKSRASKAGLPEGDPRHGLNGYTNYKCRCEVCTAAGSSYYRIKRGGSAPVNPEPKYGTAVSKNNRSKR